MTRSVRSLIRRARRHPRGAAAMLVTLLLPVFVGFVALSTDTAVLATARAQLSTAADSAALAGAVQLVSSARQKMGTIGAADIANAQAKSTQFALANSVLGSGAILKPNATNANTGAEDLVVGYLPRPYDGSTSLLTDAASTPYFNAVQIRARRDADHTGLVPGFFSKIWGNNGSALNVGSTAVVLGASGYKSINSTTNTGCFPIVLDKDTYAAMIKGQTTDQYSYNAATGAVTSGADGVTESKLYPVTGGYPGNWGTINVGVTNNSTSIIGNQIRYGVTPAQMATYPGGVIQPDPTTGVIYFSGNPGISAGIKDDLTAIIGQVRRVPIYDPALTGGNGNNLVYGVIAFAPCRIMAVSFKGMNKYVIVQPATGPADPTVVWGGIRYGPQPQDFKVVLIR